MGKLPSTVLRRPTALAGRLPSAPSSAAAPTPFAPSRASPPSPATGASAPAGAAGQVRHATFVPRSRRPYQFTQLVQLSDGSTYTMRTTSPLALYRSDKDARNHILWNPSETSLRNVEVDEAGKLAAFRERYGTAWDLGGGAAPAEKAKSAAESKPAAAAAAAAAPQEGDKSVKPGAKEAKPAAAEAPADEEDPFSSLVDLISSYATEDKNIKGGLSAKDQARKEKSGKKK